MFYLQLRGKYLRIVTIMEKSLSCGTSPQRIVLKKPGQKLRGAAETVGRFI